MVDERSQQVVVIRLRCLVDHAPDLGFRPPLRLGCALEVPEQVEGVAVETYEVQDDFG